MPGYISLTPLRSSSVPLPKPDQGPYDEEYDDDACSYAEAIPRRLARACRRVKKTVHVEALGSMCKICEGEVQEEKDDQPDEMKERWGASCRQDEFAQGEEGVERMSRDLGNMMACQYPEQIVSRGGGGAVNDEEKHGKSTDVRPTVKYNGEPGPTVQHRPVDDGHEEWQCHDGCVEEGV